MENVNKWPEGFDYWNGSTTQDQKGFWFDYWNGVPRSNIPWRVNLMHGERKVGRLVFKHWKYQLPTIRDLVIEYNHSRGGYENFQDFSKRRVAEILANVNNDKQ